MGLGVGDYDRELTIKGALRGVHTLEVFLEVFA